MTDAGNNNTPTPCATTGNVGALGATFDGKIAAIFATNRLRARDEISCTTEGSKSMDYYVSGVADGKWNVTVNGKRIGTFEASAEGGMLTFTAPAGRVVITPAE